VNHPERGTPSTDDNREQLISGWMKVVLRGARMRIGKWRLS
jgi:hypothetical protein